MNSKEKLMKVFEYLINEESDKATEMLKSYILETAASIHQDIVETEEDILEMERSVEHGDQGEDLADEIAFDKDEIASEEMMGEDEEMDLDLEDGDLEVHDGEDLDVQDDHDLSLEDLADEVAELEDEVSHSHDEFADKFAKLEAEFAKLVSMEEPEHGEDIDGDGDIADGEMADGDIEGPDGMEHGVMEAIELSKVKVDMKDKTPSVKSPIASQKSRIDLGGTPVKITGTGHTGFAREEMKPKGEVTKHTNTVSSGKAAISNAPKVNATDKAPHAGKSPAMPKK